MLNEIIYLVAFEILLAFIDAVLIWEGGVGLSALNSF